MNNYKALRSRNVAGENVYVVGLYKDGALVHLIRHGHEVQTDAIGLGEIMTWKSPSGARMYAALLCRGVAV